MKDNRENVSGVVNSMIVFFQTSIPYKSFEENCKYIKITVDKNPMLTFACAAFVENKLQIHLKREHNMFDFVEKNMDI